jgi:LysR family transcriptional regulator, low CO2-responsive transcriptional regulator
MKNLTLRQFKTFESVARHGSFSRAAEDLCLTQPAVSMQIKQMEDLLGVALFHHTGKRIELSEAGALLLQHSRVILGQCAAAQASLEHLKSGFDRPLKIGVITSGSYFFPRLVSAFAHSRPDLKFDLSVRNRDQLVEQLRENQLDLAVMLHAPEEKPMVAQPFAPTPFVMVAAPMHPLARERRLDLARIGDDCLIVRECGTDTRNIMNHVFSNLIGRSRLIEIPCAEAIKQAVMSGMGISFLSAHAVQLELHAGLLAILDVQGFPIQRHWCVVHRDDKPLAESARAFKQFLLDEGATQINRLYIVDSAHPQATENWNTPYAAALSNPIPGEPPTTERWIPSGRPS